MATSRNPVWAELVQLVPIVSLAFPFVVAGEVDFGRAASGFLLAALLTIPVSAAVLWRKHVSNPILVGTALWLWAGALAFTLPIPRLVAWFAETQAFGLFALVFVVGIATTFFAPHGFIGARHDERRWVVRASLGLLALSAVALVWAWVFRRDVRVGGGLPFIFLNVARRIAISRRTRAR